MLVFYNAFHVVIRRGVRLRPFTASCTRGAAPSNFSHHLNIFNSTIFIKYIELFINIWNRVSEARACAKGLICSLRNFCGSRGLPRVSTYETHWSLRTESRSLICCGERDGSIRRDAREREGETERGREGERGREAHTLSLS